MVSIFNVPVEDWAAFCQEFSNKHAGEPVTIEVLSSSQVEDPAAESTVIARECPMHSLRLEHSGGEDLLIFLDRHSPQGGPQFVVVPRQIRLEQPDTNEPGRLRVDTVDGQVLFLHLPVPVLPGLLDGI